MIDLAHGMVLLLSLSSQCYTLPVYLSSGGKLKRKGANGASKGAPPTLFNTNICTICTKEGWRSPFRYLICTHTKATYHALSSSLIMALVETYGSDGPRPC